MDVLEFTGSGMFSLWFLEEVTGDKLMAGSTAVSEFLGLNYSVGAILQSKCHSLAIPQPLGISHNSR